MGGAINYASQRLRKDGGKHTNDFATDFLKLVKKASESKCKDIAELQQVINKQRAETEHVQQELQQTRLQAAADSEELALFRRKYESADKQREFEQGSTWATSGLVDLANAASG